MCEEIECKYCLSHDVKKNGSNNGIQRYYCKSCQRSFSNKPPRFSDKYKRFSVMLYLNNVGIRKVAKFLKVSPTSVFRWIKEFHKKWQDSDNKESVNSNKTIDIIEFDEIYTYVKKNEIELQYGLLILENKSVLLRLKSVMKS